MATNIKSYYNIGPMVFGQSPVVSSKYLPSMVKIQIFQVLNVDGECI